MNGQHLANSGLTNNKSAGYDNAQTAQTERQVSAACGRIEMALEQEAKLLEEFETALQSVLRIEPVDANKSPQDTQSNVPLASSLHAYAERTERHSAVLASMLRRLEI